jgi:succinylglutamate desuccinylase
MDASITLAMREQDWAASKAAYEAQIASLQANSHRQQDDDSKFQAELRAAQMEIGLLKEAAKGAAALVDQEKQATLAMSEELKKAKFDVERVAELQNALDHAQMLKNDLEARLSQKQPLTQNDFKEDNEKLLQKVCLSSFIGEKLTCPS